MTLSEYARHRGCDLKAVQFAVERQRIFREPDGRLDSEKADRDWEKNTNHANARYGPKHRRSASGAAMGGGGGWAGHKADSAAAALAEPEKMAGSMSFANARTIKEIYDAKLKKLEHDEKQGKLISRRDVEVAAFNRFRVLRDAILNVPTRIAAQLAAETDTNLVHEIIETELRTVLEEFSGGKLG